MNGPNKLYSTSTHEGQQETGQSARPQKILRQALSTEPTSAVNNEVVPDSVGLQVNEDVLNEGEPAKASASRAVRPAPAIHSSGLVRGTNSDVTRVLLVDSETLVRCGIRAILEVQPDFDIVGEAESCREAARHAQLLDVDVVLVHAQGQTITLVEAIRELVGRSNRTSVRVLILKSAGREPLNQGEMLRAGASGLVLKDSGPQELTAAVRMVAAGYEILAPSTTAGFVEEAISGRLPVSECPSEFQELTAREQQVFNFIVRGYSNAEISENLTLSDSTVKSHVTHLLTKLNLRNRIHATIYAYEYGLIRPGSRLSIQDGAASISENGLGNSVVKRI